MIHCIFKQVIELKEFGFVLQQLVRQQLILRYRRTALGFLWTLINPLLMMTVTAVVFSTLFKFEFNSYVVFLFAGMIPWNYFNSTVVQSSASFINNEGLIKKIYLPKSIFPLSVSLGVLIDSVLSFFALFLIILAVGGKVSLSLFFIPLAFLLLFLFTLGVVLVVAVATVFFRDLQYIITVAMQALFFLTPILYNKDMLNGKVGFLVSINPMVSFIDLFRLPLDSGVLPPSEMILIAFFWAILSMTIGLIVFTRCQNKIVFRL